MIYDIMASVYDQINADLNYSSWADFIQRIVERECKGMEVVLALDLGCGTGKMTLELARRGYDMTGVDCSSEMLDVANEVAENAGFSGDILWLLQDMSEFELYGTVDLTVSCLDCVNHITDTEKLKKCFSLVHNYLVPDGLFIFDINGKRKFEEIYSDRSYVYETDKGVCVWQNYYNKKRQLCDFYITFFKEGQDGRYTRYDDVQRERMYRLATLQKYLYEAGFEFIGAYSDFDFTEADDNDERIYIVAKCKKG